MKNSLLFILCLFILITAPLNSKAQFKLYKEIPINSHDFTTDQLGNLYVLADNQLIKYNKEGKELFEFSSNRYGEINSVDAFNPYKILLFYRDFSNILFLDNMLSLTGNPIDLQKLELEQTTLACNSHNNGIWTFNPLQRELIRLNEQLNISAETGNLEQQLNIDLEPNFLVEYNNKVYLNNPKTGILIFDIYGTYIKTIPFKNLKNFQVKETGIVFTEDNSIVKYQFKTLETKKLKTGLEDFKKVHLVKDILYAQTDNYIRLYHIK